MNWYNITAIKTTQWSSDFQVFGPGGYNLLPVPFIPPQGAFLTVGAGSYSAALSEASAAGSYLLTSFSSYSNASGVYVFYAPLSFGDVVPATLLELLPSSEGGFASAITASSFTSLLSPMVTLAGVRGSSGFTHTLVLGSIVTSALDTTFRPNFLKYFGTTITSLSASNKSISSTINFHFLDGLVYSADSAAKSGNPSGGSFYSLSLSQSKKVFALNATVDQLPTALFAQRLVDRGVLMPDQNVSVTITLSNPDGPTSLSVVGFSDNWWSASGLFKLVRGNTTVSSQSIGIGSSISPTYVLQYIGSSPQQFTIPPVAISYSYKVGSAIFNGRASTNPVTLSLGTAAPVVLAYVLPASSSPNYEGAVGSAQSFTVTAENVGTLTASSVVIAGQTQNQGIVAGTSIPVTVQVNSPNLINTNLTRSYAVSFSSPGGQAETATTNTIPVVFSHSSMTLGLASLTVGATVSFMSSGKTNLTFTFVSYNGGSANLTGFAARGTLPPGLGCGKVRGSGLTCSGETVSLSYASVTPKGAESSSLTYNLTSPQNYFLAPLTFTAQASGYNLAGASNAVAAPSGVSISKQFSPPSLFTGMDSTVDLNLTNAGPWHYYNASILSTADVFDKIPASSSNPIATSSDVSPGRTLTATYTINASTTQPDNYSSTVATAKLFLGGVPYTLSQSGPVVDIYQPLTVSIQTNPSSPIEGHPFSIGVTISNPSAVPVTGVTFTLPIPSAMTLSQLQNAALSGGNLLVSVNQLGPHASAFANMTAQASSGITVLFSSGSLHFSYAGATLKSTLPNKDIVVGEDVLIRYTLPSALVLLAVLATAFYLRRKAAPSAPASQT